MQLDLPFLLAPSPDPAIAFVRVRRARRYILRVRPDGSLRVTVPRGGSRADALRFIERHLHWVLEERLRGAVALNFRLVQMPPEVCEYVLLHELMHLKQQNHGVRFWRLVEAACPGFRAAERWLKTEGRGLF